MVEYQPHAISEYRPVLSAESDEILAARAATDAAAFAELYNRYVARIDGYCRQRLHNADLAEDATHQIFLRALESLRKHPVDNVAAWLFTIAHNECIDRYRRHRAHVPIEMAVEMEGIERSPEDQAIARSMVRELWDLLPLLGEDQRQVLELRLAGLSSGEIEIVLGKSRSWVGVTQHRAVLRLRALMGVPAIPKER
jgi:RNA polymerase sigma-70 factor (ECF subfamily)